MTAGGETMKMLEPFFVLATQNPIEQEGTYPLPEAQLDRFIFNLWIDYPTAEEEQEIVRQTTSAYKGEVEKVLNADQIVGSPGACSKGPRFKDGHRSCRESRHEHTPGKQRSSFLYQGDGQLGSRPPCIPMPYPGRKRHEPFLMAGLRPPLRMFVRWSFPLSGIESSQISMRKPTGSAPWT